MLKNISPFRDGFNVLLEYFDVFVIQIIIQPISI